MREGSSALRGKAALVTGAARRIGRAVALALADRGANLVLHYRSAEDEARALADEVRRLGVEARVLQADFDREDELQGLVPEACRLAGGVDYLVNNASVFEKSGMDLAGADLEAAVRTNAFAPLVLTREVARQGREAAVVNLLDTRIVETDPSHVAYLVSKRALFTLTRMSAMEFAPRVRVNAVAPGLVLPPPGEDDSFLERMAPGDNPLGRHGTAAQVAEAVVFLLESEFTTGQVVFVDGGRHMKGATYGGL